MGKEAYLARIFDEYYQSVQWVGFQTAGDPMETPLVLGRRSSEMSRSALLGSPAVWITKDFKTRDQ